MDLKSVFSIDNQNQIALNLVNSDKFVGHYQHTMTDSFSPYQLAVGIRNITEGPYTTWNNGQYVQEVNMSPYIVNTFYKDMFSFSIGYGIRAFNHDVKTLNGVISFIENLNGVFFAYGFHSKIIDFMGEYDGRDINFGIKIKPNDSYEINFALTEQFISGDYNPQHDNAPRRQITFGISSRNLFSHNNHFNKQIRDLNLKIAQLEQEELKRLNEEKKEIEVQIISKEDVLKSKVADLYSNALIKYNNRNYSGAIKDLQQALKLDPNNAIILTRLGSVYYTYGFTDYAAYYWNKAIKIDPNLPELEQIKEFLAKY